MHKEKKRCLDILNALNSRLDQIEPRFQNMDETQLNAQETPNSWTVLQILEHMRGSEMASVLYVKKGIDKGINFKPANFMTKLKTRIMILAFQSKFKFNAPNIPGLHPNKTDLEVNKLFKKWRNDREQLESFLKEFDDEMLNLTVYKHPIPGVITLRGMLKFFEVHKERHLRQIERTLKNA